MTTREAILRSPTLRMMTLDDLLACEQFKTNLAAYIKCQRDDRQMARDALPKTQRPYAHTIDRIEARGLFDTDKFAEEYKRVLFGVSVLSSAERKYIEQLGMQAYNATLVQIAWDDFPEANPLNTKKI